MVQKFSPWSQKSSWGHSFPAWVGFTLAGTFSVPRNCSPNRTQTPRWLDDSSQEKGLWQRTERLGVTYPVETHLSPRLRFSAILHSRSPVQRASSFHHDFHTEGKNGKSRRYRLLVFIRHLKGLIGVVDGPTILWMRNQSCCIVPFFPGFKAVKIGFFCTAIMSKICWIQDDCLH